MPGILLAASGRAATGGSFLPSDIPGLIQWHKADAIGGLSNNDPVSTWTATTGNSATASGSARPTYKTNVLNGLPSVYFDGTNNFMTGAVTLGGTTLTVFAVADMNASALSYARVLSVGVLTTVDYSDVKYAAAILRDSSADALCGYRNGSKSTKAISTSTPFSAASVFDGTDHTMYVNGSGGTAVGSTGTFDCVDYAIGCNTQVLDEAKWYGNIYEICVYSGALNGTELGQLRTYASTKWTTP
jgi:hypothetical protein